MKNLFLSAFILLIAISSVQAQNYDVKWGEPYKKDGGLFGLYYLIGLYENHYYVMMNPKRKNLLLKYNLNHKLVSTKSVDMEYKGKNINVNKFLTTKNATYGYIASYDKKAAKMNIFVSDFNNGKFGSVRKIHSHDYKIKTRIIGIAGITNYSNYDASTLISSDDKSHSVYTNVYSSVDSKDQEEMNVAVFDADMKVVWKKKQKFNFKDKKFNIQKAVVGNDGTVYVLAKIFEKKKMKKKDKSLPKFEYKVYEIKKDSKKEIAVDLGTGLAPLDAGLFFPKEGKAEDIVIGGFYTDVVKKSGIKGIFYASGNVASGLKNINKHNFSADFLEGMARKKDIEKDRGLRGNFDIQTFMEFADGSVGFIAENNYTTTTTYTDSRGNIQYRTIYHTDDIIIPRFSASGDFMNIEKIEKSFQSGTRLNTSYTSALYDNKTYLIFNDFKNRKDRKEMKGKQKARWRYTDMVVIDEQGEITYNETLFNSKEIDLEFVPHLSDYYNNTFLIGSMSRKKYAFGTLKL